MKFKKVFLFGLSLIGSLLFASPLGNFYSYVFNIPPGFYDFFIPPGFYDFFSGLVPAFIFFLTLLFTAFGGSKKYWWIGILLLPAVAFEVYFDLIHMYFPVLLGLLGWGIGFGINKLLSKSN